MPAAITGLGEDREQLATRVCLAEQQGGVVAGGHRIEGTFRSLFHFLRGDVVPGNVRVAVVRPVEVEHHVSVSRS